MYGELFADPTLPLEAKRLERETMATVHLLCADVLRSARDWSGCVAHLGRAVTWSPTHALGSWVAARIAGVRRRLSLRVHGKDATERPPA